MSRHVQPPRTGRTGVRARDFETVHDGYLVVPALMWLAALLAALLGTPERDLSAQQHRPDPAAHGIGTVESCDAGHPAGAAAEARARRECASG